MAEVDVICQKLRQKENDLLDFESDFYRKKWEFEQKQEEAHGRLRSLHYLVNEENEKMYRILSRFEASTDEAKDFFLKEEELLAEADFAHRNYQHQLMMQEEEFDYECRRQHENIESAIEQLRRDYFHANTN